MASTTDRATDSVPLPARWLTVGQSLVEIVMGQKSNVSVSVECHHHRREENTSRTIGCHSVLSWQPVCSLYKFILRQRNATSIEGTSSTNKLLDATLHRIQFDKYNCLRKMSHWPLWLADAMIRWQNGICLSCVSVWYQLTCLTWLM